MVTTADTIVVTAVLQTIIIVYHCLRLLQVQSRKQELSQLREQLLDEEIEQLRPANVGHWSQLCTLLTCLLFSFNLTL